MNLRHLTFSIPVLTAVLGFLGALPAEEPTPGVNPTKEASATSFGKDVVPFLTKHCYSCHGGGKSKGDVTLDKYRDAQAVLKDRDVWEKVVEMVQTGQMPPKSKDNSRPRPTPSEVDLVTRAIDGMLEHFDCTGHATTAGSRSAGSTGSSTTTRSATSSASTSSRPPTSPTTTSVTASTTSATCCRCRRCFWRNTCPPPRRSSSRPSSSATRPSLRRSELGSLRPTMGAGRQPTGWRPLPVRQGTDFRANLRR